MPGWAGRNGTNTGGNRNAGRDEGGQRVRVMLLFVLCSVYFFFSLFFFSIVYSTTSGRVGRNVTGPSRVAQQRRTGQGGRWAGRGGGEGNLDERASTADKEDKRAGQDGGWATLMLSCLLLGFEIC